MLLHVFFPSFLSNTSIYLDGFNIGVTTDIRILHESIGMTNDEWEKNRQLFVKKYKEDLPITYSDYD